MIVISTEQSKELTERIAGELSADDASTRLRAALEVGSNPNPDLVDTLVARCAIEVDFYVRDMLTWALTRLPSELTLPLLFVELGSEHAQARSQALHTLSKIQDASVWPAITTSMLRDANDEVAQSAWRAAVVLVPIEQKALLAEELATQFGRGTREVRLSLSSALVALGESAVAPIIEKGMASKDPIVQAHATATNALLRDPDASFEFAMNQVKRLLAPGD